MPNSQDILVSIIVPAYNVNRTLRRCIDSLLAQTHRNIEIIVIDDRSSDGSARTAHILEKQHAHVKLVELPVHLGSYRARREGIKYISGEMLMFVDADDTMEPAAVEIMLDAMMRHNVDLVQMRMRRRMKGINVKYQEQWNPELADRRIDGMDFRSLASYVGMDSYIYPPVWGKMYRTSLLRSFSMIDFNQFWGDDQIFNIQYLRHCRSMAFVDFVGYSYYWGGATSSYRYSQLAEYKSVFAYKRLLGQNTEYINAEIIMLLRYHVRQLITELSWTREAVIKVMMTELRDPLWKQVGLNIQAEQLVTEEFANVQKAPLKYLVKKLLK